MSVEESSGFSRGRGFNKKDVIIIGAGASGLMCAIESGKRGRSVLVLDHASKLGRKIHISGGGRCNFTNINTSHKNFISNNPHFSKSALSRFKPRDIITMLEKHGVKYEEREEGQLFLSLIHISEPTRLGMIS